MTPSGWAVVREALCIGPWRDVEDQVTPHTRPPVDQDASHVLVRTIECVQGTVNAELICEPLFDYGRTPAEWSMHPGTSDQADATGGDLKVRLTTDMRLGIEGNRARARHQMNEGEKRFCALSWSAVLDGPRSTDQAEAMLAETSHYWRTWLAAGHYPDHRLRGWLQRSALALKGLTYSPTGATVAALTTSLPETPHGERNWDYRFSWMRDASFTLWSLHALGLDWEADDFMQFVADLERNEDGSLQIMYGIDGEQDLTERTLDHLHGYDGAVPVRVGNGAFSQRQNDVYGAVLDSVYLHTKASGYIPERLWPVLEAQVEAAIKVWKEPDQGIWEARGEPKHYVSSKLMCWVALDRARAAGPHARRRGGREAAGPRWPSEIRADILEHGVRGTGSSASTTTPTRSTPRCCWCRSCASCPTTTSACARPCWPSRGS